MQTRWMWIAAVSLGLAAGTTVALRAAEEGEVKVKMADCPPAVQKTLREEAFGATIETVDKEKDHGKTVYEADVVIGGKNYEIKVADDGTLLHKKLDNEGEEVKVKFADAPAAVQKTLQEQAKGAKIESVDKETKNGKTIYEADVVIDGKTYEIQVAEDGKLIGKDLDKEDKKDEKKEEKK